MQQILYEAAVQMFFKIGVLKNLQIYQKKGSSTGIFLRNLRNFWNIFFISAFAFSETKK